MEFIYKATDAFIFELMVESCREGKKIVLERIKNRIDIYLRRTSAINFNILMFGDGVGSDTIFLYNHYKGKASIYYFDVPGSKTFEFAQKRFEKYGINISLITNYDDIPSEFFDIVVCLEILEHLQDPISAIVKIQRSLKQGGIALITESFAAVTKEFLTHLKSNLRYAYLTHWLFIRQKLILSYYPKDFPKGRPMEFVKVEHLSFATMLKLLKFSLNRDIIVPLIKTHIKRFLWRV